MTEKEIDVLLHVLLFTTFRPDSAREGLSKPKA
jgi:hypothetical protein